MHPYIQYTYLFVLKSVNMNRPHSRLLCRRGGTYWRFQLVSSNMIRIINSDQLTTRNIYRLSHMIANGIITIIALLTSASSAISEQLKVVYQGGTITSIYALIDLPKIPGVDRQGLSRQDKISFTKWNYFPCYR